MSSVYSTRFVAGVTEGGAIGDVYYVPTGYVAVVVCADFTTTASDVEVLIDANGVIMYAAAPALDVDGIGHAQYTGRYVLNAGEFIAVSATGPAYGGVNGYLLTEG